MITAVRVELLKIRTSRLTLGLLALACGLTALITLVQASRAGGGGQVPTLASQEGLTEIVTETGFGMLVAAVLGITVVSGENRHNTITDTYVDEPNRTRVLVAKAVAAGASGALVGLVSAAVANGIGLGYVYSRGYDVPLSVSTMTGYGAGALLGAALMAALGVGVGSLVRSQIAAIIGVFVWALAVEQIIGILSSGLAAYLPITTSYTLAGATTRAAMPPVIGSGVDPLSVPAAAAVLAGFVLVVATVAARTTVRRDIS